MKRLFLILAFGIWMVPAAGAQEPVQAQEDSSPASTQEEGRMTWEDLKEEHKSFVGEQREENRAWREDFRDRWHQAIEQCKGSGVNPGDCHQQYLKDLRQEAKAYHQQQKQEWQQHHKDMVENRQEHIQQWKESHPGVNPPGPVGGPGAGPHFKDRLEDVRDHREDIRDHREDVRDRREDRRDRGALPPSEKLSPRDAKRAYQEHPGAGKQLHKDAVQHPEAAKKAYRGAQKNPGGDRKAVQAGREHPKAAVEQHHKANR